MISLQHDDLACLLERAQAVGNADPGHALLRKSMSDQLLGVIV
ncbi:hypothetical protein EV13_0765 [Prochlorococcus sp. MIT 0702]|nr:hypothetical protein EV12_0277 [Prochlorococcus sp. MIT 0701]KGG29961.1 hypothetical protein EV13_0765 [Prochlorococcus sp. MIT 0702]KGG36963.1 hypothetical protein EV14_0173 [Prochlorococcus sp. MIT 0703]